jgi:(p)ppGpp synthase/HD superfamily hydrolase
MHGKVHQEYDGHPYRLHLKLAANEAKRFIHLIPEGDRDCVIAGTWVHDTIEDTGVTYNDVLKHTNKVVAEYAYACTNDKGRNRAERANPGYYYGIRIYKHASFIKLCDRLANVRYGKEHKDGMFAMYKREYPFFKEHLYDGRWDEMWKELEKLLGI